MAGRGVDLKNEEEVQEYIENLGIEYRFGCYYEKNPVSCHLLGDYMEAIKQDAEKAFRIYDTNCTVYKHGHSCHKVASAKMRGKGTIRSMDEAYSYYTEGCNRGFARSCLHAGVLDTFDPDVVIRIGVNDEGMARAQAPDYKKAESLLQKACDGDEFEACHKLSEMYITGFKNVIQKDFEKAFPLAVKACGAGVLNSCVNVSVMYRNGDGVPVDHKKADEYVGLAKEIVRQMQDATRLTFQEGVESAE